MQRSRPALQQVILVSNEVGLSIVPENAMARRFRDEQGLANQALAAHRDNVYFIAAGLPLKLKGDAYGSNQKRNEQQHEKQHPHRA